MASLVNSTKHVRRKYKFFQKTEQEEILPNLINEDSNNTKVRQRNYKKTT